jgi:hypothetical protein
VFTFAGATIGGLDSAREVSAPMCGPSGGAGVRPRTAGGVHDFVELVRPTLALCQAPHVKHWAWRTAFGGRLPVADGT